MPKRTGTPAPGKVQLPDLVDSIDDNSYLAAAARAAEVDKASGAYDEFLFSDDRVAEMPFETATEKHLGLVATRLTDRGNRAILGERSGQFGLQSQLASEEVVLADMDAQIAETEARLAAQREVLQGERDGHHGLKWTGAQPEFTSTLNARLRLLATPVIFLLVGSVDLALIFFSFFNLGMSALEAAAFTAPAVGIQVFVPHFLGVRISMMRRKAGQLWLNLGIAAVLLGVWVGFALALTNVRVTYFIDAAERTGHSLTTSPAVLYYLNLLLLIGLGLILVVHAVWHNHHEVQFLRLDTRRHALLRRRRRTLKRIAKIESRLATSDEALKVAKASYETAVSAARDELEATTRAVYRRALINSVGSVDFTATYLNAGEPAAARPTRPVAAPQPDGIPSLPVETSPLGPVDVSLPTEASR